LVAAAVSGTVGIARTRQTTQTRDGSQTTGLAWLGSNGWMEPGMSVGGGQHWMAFEGRA